LPVILSQRKKGIDAAAESPNTSHRHRQDQRRRYKKDGEQGNMATNISDYVNVRQKMADLGCRYPHGLALLPANFEHASSIAEFRQVSEAATVKALFRNEQLPHDEIVKPDQRPPYIQNNHFEWVAPTIFISYALFSQNPQCVSVALSVIANYATDFFKGMSGNKSIKLDIVVEKTKTKTCKKITYQGDVQGLKELPSVIREVADE